MMSPGGEVPPPPPPPPPPPLLPFLQVDKSLLSNPPKSSLIQEPEFDDSLEDSGLDIKMLKDKEGKPGSGYSDGDEEKGSGSDSGNENDIYIVLNEEEEEEERSQAPQPHSPSLYISVEDAASPEEEAAKLSPADSVLCDSEISSTESIPDAMAVSTQQASKRPAPAAPITYPPIYDDIANVSPKKEDPYEEEEENLKVEVVGGGKNKMGSYSFVPNPCSRADADADVLCLEEVANEEIPTKVDGIEFIGIRKIDSELLLKEEERRRRRSSPREEGSIRRRERSSSTSPKSKRKINQFFSTIGKRAGAAFKQGTGHGGGGGGITPTSSLDERCLSGEDMGSSSIYATLTPSSLKFKGVLNKLSNLGKEQDQEHRTIKGQNPKISKFKKLLRIGGGGVGGGFPAIDEKASTKAAPPPPPPRIASLDLLRKGMNVNSHGTVRPARPPPPRVPGAAPPAPSFTSVFNQDDGSGLPPAKPRRRNSVNVPRAEVPFDTPTSHIANLNLETLRLLSNQPIAKISSTLKLNEVVGFQDFEKCLKLLDGEGFAFYSGKYEGLQPCVLLVMEEEGGGKSSGLELSPCVIPFRHIEDEINSKYLPWKTKTEDEEEDEGEEYSVQARISILPSFEIWKLDSFVQDVSLSSSEKILALLQSMRYWGEGKEEEAALKELFVLKGSSNNIHVHPLRSALNCKGLSKDFEISMKKLLFGCDNSVLSEKDRGILLQKLGGSESDVRAQLKLFFQLKLFSPEKGTAESIRIKRGRNEMAVQQWLEKERAICMKEAVERSLSGLSSHHISTKKKEYFEFLMQSATSAKIIADLFVELFD